MIIYRNKRSVFVLIFQGQEERRVLQRTIAGVFGVLILAGIIGLWSEARGGDWFASLDQKVGPFQVTVTDLIFSLAMLLYLPTVVTLFYRSIIVEKDVEIKEKNRELQEAGKELLIQFKDYVAFKDQHSMFHAMKQYVEREPYVLAVQMYSFGIKHSLLNTRVKIAYKEGYVTEAEDINAIIQEYTMIPRDVMRRFERGLHAFQQGSPLELLSFIKYCVDQLSKLSQPKIKPNHAVIYTLLNLAVKKVFYPSTLLADTRVPEVQHLDFSKYRRTGVLRAILDTYGSGDRTFSTEDFHLFVHDGNERDHRKAGRIYFAKYAPTKQGNHILLIVVNPDILVEKNTSLSTFEKMSETFVRILEEHDVLLEYNNVTARKRASIKEVSN